MKFLFELFEFLYVRKKFWLAPIIIIMLLFGLLIIFPPTRKLFLKKVSKNYSEKVKEKQDFIDGESEDIEGDNDRKF